MNTEPIIIVDYGLGNLGSVANMFRRLGVPATVSASSVEIAAATCLVLPGVGAFDEGMRNLEASGLQSILERRVREDKVPVLGICLGMQLLSRGSEEGARPGLGWIDADTRRLSTGNAKLKIPHMGWNETVCTDPDLFGGLLETKARFYYVHSFHVVPDDETQIAARCTYGAPFVAAVRKGHVFGTQFHPEKSHRFGLEVLANFARATGRQALREGAVG